MKEVDLGNDILLDGTKILCVGFALLVREDGSFVIFCKCQQDSVDTLLSTIQTGGEAILSLMNPYWGEKEQTPSASIHIVYALLTVECALDIPRLSLLLAPS